ncbi:MAG: thioredoxin domain-containing protein [Candidatus Altiarchaeota archaeon]
MTKNKNNSVSPSRLKGKHALAFALLAVAVVLAYKFTAGQSAPEVLPTESLGSESNILQVIEYSDFKCPYCGKAAETVEQLRDEYDGRIEIVFKHFPLTFHAGSDRAAEASECARDQGLFWEYHDRLFEDYANGRDIGEADVLKSIAGELNLDADNFSRCLDSGAKKDVVKKNLAEGKRLGVSGTPTFFIKGKKIVGAQPYDVFADIIDGELGEQNEQE